MFHATKQLSLQNRGVCVRERFFFKGTCITSIKMCAKRRKAAMCSHHFSPERVVNNAEVCQPLLILVLQSLLR